MARRFVHDPVVAAAWGPPLKEMADTKGLAESLGTPACEFAILAGNGNRDARVKEGEADDPDASKEGSTIGNPLVIGTDDFMVSVEETKLAGAADFAVLPVTHMSIKRDAKALEYTLRFLDHGYFVSPEKRQPLK
jgi:hypothetical protein